MPVEQHRGLIESTGCNLSVREQCQLLSVPRGTLYYRPRGVKAEDLSVTRRLDELYKATPFYGVERMTAALHRDGPRVGHYRGRRLLRLMGLEALYPKPRLSVPGGPEHRGYPYLLRGLRIDHPNQVWSSDTTYVRLRQGFAYLVAILDWFSRYVLSGGSRRRWTPGSAWRLWRSVKYEDVYLKEYEAVDEAVRVWASTFTSTIRLVPTRPWAIARPRRSTSSLGKWEVTM